MRSYYITVTWTNYKLMPIVFFAFVAQFSQFVLQCSKFAIRFASFPHVYMCVQIYGYT